MFFDLINILSSYHGMLSPCKLKIFEKSPMIPYGQLWTFLKYHAVNVHGHMDIFEDVKQYRRIILWRKIILKISLYNCDFQCFMG